MGIKPLTASAGGACGIGVPYAPLSRGLAFCGGCHDPAASSRGAAAVDPPPLPCPPGGLAAAGRLAVAVLALAEDGLILAAPGLAGGAERDGRGGPLPSPPPGGGRLPVPPPDWLWLQYDAWQKAQNQPSQFLHHFGPHSSLFLFQRASLSHFLHLY